jgi:protein sidekick
VPGAPPSNIQASGNSPTSCRVQWGEVPEDLHNGLILGYNITFLKENEPDTALEFVVVEGVLSNTTNLIGLGKFTKYNISIAAFTVKGPGNESGLISTECQTEESGKL